MGVNYPKRNTSLELELQRTREDLDWLERYIEEFSEFLPLPFCIVNPLNVIIGVSQAFQDLIGYDEMEIVGSEVIPLFLEKKEATALTEEILKKDIRITREMTLLTKDKRKIPVSVSGLVRKDEEENSIGYFLALSDISEVKEFQAKLEERVGEKTKELESRTEELEKSRKALVNILEDIEQSLRRTDEEKNKTLAVITHLADGLLVFDKENKLSLINYQAEKFLDIKAREVIGYSILELINFPNFKILRDLLGAEIKSVFRKELTLGKNLTIEVSTELMLPRGEKLGTLVILHDISREKMVEKIKSEFVTIAAHQLRTPLSAIKWTLKMLLDGDLGKITKEQGDFIEKTYQSNERMISLINDLLNVTRIEEGRYLSKLTPASFEEVVVSILNYYQEEITRRKINLEFEKSQIKLPEISIDVEKIKLAIQNLLDNAIKYTPPGGKIAVSLGYRKDKKEIIFSVKDTGVGIPRDQQSRVFTKFFRGANVVRMETEGSGLGLFISKNIIEAHDGKIWFESEEGQGTTFYIVLPVKREL